MAGSRHLVSTNGTVGHDVRKVQEFSYPFPTDAVLVLHSDGLTSHWNLSNYPGLLRKPPGLIAGILYRDYQRGTDDVTVVAARATSVRRSAGFVSSCELKSTSLFASHEL